MKFIVSFFLLVFFSCNYEKTKLSQALDAAEGNRSELEKVLNYYSVNEIDSLKYRAACFLIENMPGHYSYYGDEIKQYYAEILPIIEKDIPLEKKFELANSIYSKYLKNNNRKIQDIKFVTADYLIWNIERSFKLWKEMKWLEHISFDYFCEYILPYKVTELQNLDHWKDTLFLKYKYLIEDIPESQLDASIYLRTQTVTDYIRTTLKEVNTFNIHGESRRRSYNLLDASTIDKIPFGLCSDYVNSMVSILRSLGIPSHIDNFPFWQYVRFGHNWYSVLHDNGRIISALEFSDAPGTLFAPMQKYTKVFRKTYSHNPRVVQYFSETKYRHPSIELFQKDVTNEYVTTRSIDIPINKKGLKDKYAYLATFCGRKWQIIDFAKIANNKVKYNQVTGGSIYLIMGYDGKEQLRTVTKPFILHNNGKIEYLNTDWNNKSNIMVYRKFPKKINTARMENRIVGGEIQASYDRNFLRYETFYKFKNINFPDTIKLTSEEKYRYWRFYSKENSLCNIAELQFYKKGEEDFAKREIIGEKKMFDDNPKFAPEKSFDGLWNTGYMAPKDLEKTNVWIGIDFGEPVNVDRIHCLARSDDNSICTGNEYELMFWGDNKWESLGQKFGADKVLVYESVPGNTIYWLKNHTRGTEEGVFTYKDGKQVWW